MYHPFPGYFLLCEALFWEGAVHNITGSINECARIRNDIALCSDRCAEWSIQVKKHSYIQYFASGCVLLCLSASRTHKSQRSPPYSFPQSDGFLLVFPSLQYPLLLLLLLFMLHFSVDLPPLHLVLDRGWQTLALGACGPPRRRHHAPLRGSLYKVCTALFGKQASNNHYQQSEVVLSICQT
jgi:hypothetical protein